MKKKKEVSAPNPSDEDTSSNSPTSPTVAYLAESNHLLELTTNQVQSDIRESFARLTEVLRSREKQLLRQVEVLHGQQIALLQSQQALCTDRNSGEVSKAIPHITVDLDQEKTVHESLLSFGKVDVEGGNLVAIDGTVTPYSVPYKAEDYQEANRDHDCLYKPLSTESTPQHVIRFGFLPKLNSPTTSDAQQPDAAQANVVESGVEATENGSSESRDRRPSQVQQWLQQIMAETETEPSVAELEKNFAQVQVMNTSMD